MIRPHPIFALVVAATAVGGYLSWSGIGDPRLAIVVFVAAGWVLSLCLHEFGHAYVAWRGGDRSVADKGYLTLNPLKYTHVGLSLLLPLLFMAMGGLGLPGGAVWINRGALRSRSVRSAVALAGPAASAAVAGVAAAPFLLGVDALGTHRVFAAALALLALLQITAVVINLLPIPGLDGYGVIEPYLPASLRARLEPLRGYVWLGFFVLVFWTPVGSGAFWSGIGWLLDLFAIPRGLAAAALDAFRLPARSG